MSKEQRHDHVGHDEELIKIPLAPRIYPHLDEEIDESDHPVEHLYFDIGGEG